MTRFATFQETKIHYVEYIRANKPTIFLIHGLGCSLDYWSFLFDSELMKDYTFYAIDLPGYGLSSKSKTYDYSIKHQATILKKFVDFMQIKIDYLVGFSMGGPIAIALADQLSELQKLILIEPVLTINDIGISKTISNLPKCFIRVGQIIAKIAPKFALKILGKGKTKPARKIVNHAFQLTTPYALKKSSEELITYAKTKKAYTQLKKLSMEKHYLLGENTLKSERIKPPEDLFEIVQKHIIPSASHELMLDNPEAFHETLQKILKK
ncbi:MAG: alpha/beta hydrolase [Asgard group archaeon]|nr:alpha/beta hydrolase [Asgard group archaeon]